MLTKSDELVFIPYIIEAATTEAGGLCSSLYNNSPVSFLSPFSNFFETPLNGALIFNKPVVAWALWVTKTPTRLKSMPFK